METVLRSLLQGDSVPRRALPNLLELLDHPEQNVNRNTSGTLDLTTRYPIREKACQCLRRLDIECEVEKELVGQGMVPIEEGGKEVHARKFSVDIDVNERSVLERVEQWLLSQDETTWRAGVEVVSQLNRGDVQILFEQLRESGCLSDEKVRYYNRIHPSSVRN